MTGLRRETAVPRVAFLTLAAVAAIMALAAGVEAVGVRWPSFLTLAAVATVMAPAAGVEAFGVRWPAFLTLAAVAAAMAGVAAVAVVFARRRRQKSAPPLPPPPPPLPVVRLAECYSELLSIARLRYMVYVGELKRSNYSYVDNIREVLEDPLDHSEGCANLYVAHPEEGSAWGEFLSRNASAASAEVKQEVAYAAEHPITPAIGCVRIHVPLPQKYGSLFGTPYCFALYCFYTTFATTPTRRARVAAKWSRSPARIHHSGPPLTDTSSAGTPSTLCPRHPLPPLHY